MSLFLISKITVLTLIYVVSISWNKLDNILLNISNYNLFKKRLYNILLSSYSVYL